MPTLPFAPDKPWLAPLAGYSDLPFRLLCRERGACCAVTEMVSAKGLVFGSKGTRPLLATTPEDSPLVVQLFGSDERYLREAAESVLERGFTHLDHNVGCPVRKVVKTGAGVGLMNDPARAQAMVDALVGVAGPGRVGVKFRTGFTPADLNYLELGRRFEDSGAAWLTLHPRHGKQGYSGRADWDAIANLKQQTALPVLASGDLFSPRDGVDCLRQTGVDGVMYARGALSNPSIFDQHVALLSGREPIVPGWNDLADLIERHLKLVRTHGQGTNIRRMRSIVPRYLRHLPGAKALRTRLIQCETPEDMDLIIHEIRGLETSEPPPVAPPPK